MILLLLTSEAGLPRASTSQNVRDGRCRNAYRASGLVLRELKGNIVNSDAAKLYAHEVTAIMEQINQSARVLREICDGDELTMQLRRLARVAASLTDEVCNPLFTEYPQVKPADYLL